MDRNIMFFKVQDENTPKFVRSTTTQLDEVKVPFVIEDKIDMLEKRVSKLEGYVYQEPTKDEVNINDLPF